VDLFHARRTATAFLVVLFAVLAFAVPGTADTPLSHRGKFGVHYLADSREFPGTACAYSDEQTLLGVRVRDPFVYARNRSPGLDRQRVAWRFIVQERLDETADWSDFARSHIQRGVATDQQVADFHPMGMKLDSTPGAQYRVLVRMYWLVPGHVRPGIDGVATHRVDWYRLPDHGVGDHCPGAIL
jgi:hypothetical protein